jgi:NitT/TauT family transport system ATP-binding protein
MDEPFSALDVLTAEALRSEVTRLWQRPDTGIKSILLITHLIEEAVYLGDRVYVFSSAPGTILREMQVPPPDRPPKEMQREPAFVERVFEIRDLIDTLAVSTRAGDD